MVEWPRGATCGFDTAPTHTNTHTPPCVQQVPPTHSTPSLPESQGRAELAGRVRAAVTWPSPINWHGRGRGRGRTQGGWKWPKVPAQDIRNVQCCKVAQALWGLDGQKKEGKPYIVQQAWVVAVTHSYLEHCDLLPTRTHSQATASDPRGQQR